MDKKISYQIAIYKDTNDQKFDQQLKSMVRPTDAVKKALGYNLIVVYTTLKYIRWGWVRGCFGKGIED